MKPKSILTVVVIIIVIIIIIMIVMIMIIIITDNFFCSSKGYSEPGQISAMKLNTSKYKFLSLFFEFEKWRTTRASMGGVGSVLAWVAC